jgi:hypothetical protein
MDGKEEEHSAKNKKKLRRKRESAIGRQTAWSRWTTWLPMLFSAVSVVLAGLTFYVASNPWGRVSIVEEPNGLGIVRGVRLNLGESLSPAAHPADHVLVPLDWINNTGGTVLVQDPTLIFSKLDNNGALTGEQYRFHMIGKLSSLTPQAVHSINTGTATEESFTFATSVLIEPRSVAPSVAVFRPLTWGEEEPQHFRFQPGDRYRLEIEFERYPKPPIWSRSRPSALVYEQVNIGSSVEQLRLYGEGGAWGWDYWNYPYR